MQNNKPRSPIIIGIISGIYNFFNFKKKWQDEVLDQVWKAAITADRYLGEDSPEAAATARWIYNEVNESINSDFDTDHLFISQFAMDLKDDKAELLEWSAEILPSRRRDED